MTAGIPSLQVQGNADPYGTTAQTDVLTGPLVRTYVLDARHPSHLGASEAVLAEIVAFTAGLPRGEA